MKDEATLHIELQRVSLPDFGRPDTRPDITAHEYEARARNLYQRLGMDWVVVYGDREHLANIAYLSGFDPRFEEALLVLGADDARWLVVGNEGLGHAVEAKLPARVTLAQSLSLCGQPRDTAPRLADVLRQIGIGQGARIGVVGWKYLEHDETDRPSAPAFVPAMLVNVLSELVGQAANLIDGTAAMMSPADGLRAVNSAAQIAVWEWGAVRASEAVLRIVRAARAGASEYEVVRAMGYEGDPLSAHVLFASGSGAINGLRSPGPRLLAAGDGITTGVGYWGGLCARAGLLVDAVDPEFMETVVTPYYRAVATWYHTMDVGVLGGAIDATVRGAFGDATFGPLLNPGHLTSYDEWVHSPIRPGSTVAIASGMALQCDIIPSPLPAGQALNCEDTVVVADPALRAELAGAFPQLWSRVRARRAFMHDALGLKLAESLLPLSNAPAYLPPFWLAHDLVPIVISSDS
ncbi:MAG: Xaa-Pro aminopeptidase [Chloroflexi bacterium]|nr:Xaa-Pro aminopeptidase [Chloroflexota bacterium]